MFITLTRDVDTLVRERLFRETNGKMSQRLFNSGQFKLSKDEGERRMVDNLYEKSERYILKPSWRKNNKRVIENGVYFYTVAVTRDSLSRDDRETKVGIRAITVTRDRDNSLLEIDSQLDGVTMIRRFVVAHARMRGTAILFLPLPRKRIAAWRRWRGGTHCKDRYTVITAWAPYNHEKSSAQPFLLFLLRSMNYIYGDGKW